MTKYFVLVFLFCNLKSNAQSDFVLHNIDNTKDTLELEFSDEFNGNKLDEKIWNIAEGVFRDPEGVRAKIWNSKKNVFVSGGYCHLRASRDTLLAKKFEVWVGDGMKPFQNDFFYSTAEINTHKNYGYGMYEINCRVPRGKGLAPAFWMYGAAGPINCEIDIFEFWNQRGFLTKFSKKKLSRVHNMTAHYSGKQSGKSYLGPEFADEFYTYSVVWDECRIEWYVNGDLKRRISKYKKMRSNEITCERLEKTGTDLEQNVFPQNQLMNIIANLAVHTDKDRPSDNDPFPQTLDIDYIRYYKFKK